MKQKKRGNHVLRLVVIFILVALVFGAACGIVTILDRLSHYGESMTIQKDPVELPDEEETIVPSEEEEKNALPANSYQASGFSEKNGLKVYQADGVTGVPGIDISSYQTNVDWAAVKEAGVEFAMIRVGYRGWETGKLDLDDCFLSHIQGALDAGIEVGVYLFSQALTEEEAVEEAEFVLTWIEGYDITYPVVFDWEEVDVPARTDNMNMLMLTSCADAFCKTVKEAGYEPAIYFNQAYGYQQFNLVSLRDYQFWLAEYADEPSFAYDFQMWQYTNDGAVPGIDGAVDLNIYFKK